MESADIVVVSSKGQVVIPQNLRKKLGIEAKTKLLVYPYSDALIMKRLDIEDAKKELKSVFNAIDSKRKDEKVTETEVTELVQKYRHGTEGGSRDIENRPRHKRASLISDN
jgi:AbrB family looped-hinge helix DNA binding protein